MQLNLLKATTQNAKTESPPGCGCLQESNHKGSFPRRGPAGA